MSGVLYLIPTPLGEGGEMAAVLPESVRNIALSLNSFVAENPKTARQFLKRLGITRPLQDIQMTTLDEHTPPEQVGQLLAPLLAGHDVGLVSEAGCPAVADPGALLVRAAHEKGVKVVPLVGPSSILLALMASGMNGQSFTFHGYLPANREERVKRLGELDKESRACRQTQIFIETPYRNQQMFEDILRACPSQTLLCVATDITQANERIETRTLAEWKGKVPDLHKRPTIFLIYSGAIAARKPRK